MISARDLLFRCSCGFSRLLTIFFIYSTLSLICEWCLILLITFLKVRKRDYKQFFPFHKSVILNIQVRSFYADLVETKGKRSK